MKYRKSFISLLVIFAIASIFYFNHLLNSGKAQFVKSDPPVNVSPIKNYIYTAESPEITILPEKKHNNYSGIITEKIMPDSIRLTVTDSLTLPENYAVKTEEINETINIQIPAAEADNPHELEIDNLVLNETISKTGKDFYDLFYKDWVVPKNTGNHTIVIQEKPLPSMGTRITIKVDDYYVYQQVLQPRYELIKEAAQIGLNTAAAFIYNIKQIESNLQSEDLQGTGIY